MENKQKSMITIRKLAINAPFRYLWLKQVRGVELGSHCARCLLGEYDKRIRAGMKEGRDIVLPDAPYYYLCGVSMPYRWELNFHLAFQEKEGERLITSRLGISVEIENAAEVPFSQQDINPADRHAGCKSYYTCRNWQFAHKVAHEFQPDGT